MLIHIIVTACFIFTLITLICDPNMFTFLGSEIFIIINNIVSNDLRYFLGSVILFLWYANVFASGVFVNQRENRMLCCTDHMDMLFLRVQLFCASLMKQLQLKHNHTDYMGSGSHHA